MRLSIKLSLPDPSNSTYNLTFYNIVFFYFIFEPI
jgi:hypothetical protein